MYLFWNETFKIVDNKIYIINYVSTYIIKLYKSHSIFNLVTNFNY